MSTKAGFSRIAGDDGAKGPSRDLEGARSAYETGDVEMSIQGASAPSPGWDAFHGILNCTLSYTTQP